MMNIIKIKSGNSRVIASDTIISNGKSPIEIEFKATSIDGTSLEPESLCLIFSFHDDNSKKTRVDTVIGEDKKKLELKLFNFNSSLDIGNRSPSSVGMTDERKSITLNYRVRKVGDSWTLDYTIYQEE